MRLYRVGPLPYELVGRPIVHLRPEDAEHFRSSGEEDARGRWFTSVREIAESWSCVHIEPLRHVDVNPVDAARWSAATNPALQRYVTDDLHDYFVPVEIANTAVLTEDEDGL